MGAKQIGIVAYAIAAGCLYAAEPRALLDRYCVTCHNQRLKTAGLTLDTADLANIPSIPSCGRR